MTLIFGILRSVETSESSSVRPVTLATRKLCGTAESAGLGLAGILTATIARSPMRERCRYRAYSATL